MTITLQEIQGELHTQLDLTQRALSLLDSRETAFAQYLGNLGVSWDDLFQAASEYAKHVSVTLIGDLHSRVTRGVEQRTLPEQVGDAINESATIAFIRGFTIGLILGRRFKP